MWRESSLLCDRAVRIMKSQTYVFSDSVLCLGDISPEPVQAWKEKLSVFTTLGILTEIQKILAELKREREQFQGWIILMSMYNDIFW